MTDNQSTVKNESMVQSEEIQEVNHTSVNTINNTSINDAINPIVEATALEKESMPGESAPEESMPTDTFSTEAQLTYQLIEANQKLAEANQKAEKYWDSLLRKQAEVDNLQKRTARDLENAHKYALEKFVTELLAVKDSMELGLEAASKPETDLNAVSQGIALTVKMLGDILKKFEVEEIEPKQEKFNPRWHEAMAMQPVSHVEEGTVIYVHQKGYQLHDRLLRPARVIVAKAVEPT